MAMTILTVDDSKTMREMLKAVLTEAGMEVLQAKDGVDGMEVLENATPDVIITDINMPRMDGFGFIEAVRGSEKHRSTPILVLTTENTGEKKERARLAGASGWIVKPFDAVKLLGAISRVAA